MSHQFELVAFSALMFTVFLKLPLSPFLESSSLFFHLLSGVGQWKEEENDPTAQYEFFSLPLPMPNNLQIGTSLFFQKTNTFPRR